MRRSACVQCRRLLRTGSLGGATLCDGCRFVIGNNAMLHSSGFFNTVPSPNPLHLKDGLNVQMGTNPMHSFAFRMRIQ